MLKEADENEKEKNEKYLASLTIEERMEEMENQEHDESQQLDFETYSES